MKKTIVYILILALVIAGICPAMAGCASKGIESTGSFEQPTPSAQISTDSPTEKATQENTEPPTQSPVQNETTPPAEGATQPPAQNATEPPAQKATEPAAPKSTQPPVQKATEPPAQKATEPPAQEETEPPVQIQTPAVNTVQDVTDVLNSVLTTLAINVPEPAFGTLVGEWTVLCLARGEHFTKNDPYFAGYYSRIEAAVQENASSVGKNGALHRAKSTENSRLIVALSAIGKDATDVAGWNLIAPYEDFNWIKKQGINGPIWALIALDTASYQTTDPTIRQQCLDHILEKQLEDGGWALTGKVSDPDITAMTLQALFPYRDQSAVATAAQKAFTCLSNLQNSNGGYVTFGDENSESCAQVIVACTTWGINPDTDSRFIKNGTSVLDSLIAHYVAAEAGFKHVQSGKVDAMATDQGCYALVAYQRLLNGKNPLYVMGDVAR